MTQPTGPAGRDWELPAVTQAQRIIGKLGGVGRVSRWLKKPHSGSPHVYPPSAVYYWLENGLVAPDAVPALQAFARELGIPLTEVDWNPRPRPGLTMIFMVGRGWQYQEPSPLDIIGPEWPTKL